MTTMKSIFVIGSNTKEQYRIKSFLEKDYAIDFNQSVHNALEIITKHPYDVLLFDTDNVFPLRLFMDEIKSSKCKSPVSALSSKMNVAQIQKILGYGVVSIIRKPCNKKRLIKGIEESLATTLPKPEKPKPIQGLQRKEIETWLALRKDAIVTRLRMDGISLLLPTALNKDTKVLFKNAEICNMIGYQYEQVPRFEMVVNSCISAKEYLFNLDLGFVDLKEFDFHQQLGEFVNQKSHQSQESRLSKTILIAETDAFTRDFYSALLKPKGYHLKFASDGIQTLKTLETEPIDLLIMDLMLHRLGGLELIGELKKQDINVPIIVASGESSPQTVLKLAAKVQKFLLKPFDSSSFEAAVESIMEKKIKEDDSEMIPYVDVHLETNVLVTFRDRFQLLDCSRAGMVFKRTNPMAPGTNFLIRKDAIVPTSQNGGQSTPFLELRITKCKFNKNDRNYLVHSEFLTRFSS